jgi:acyl-CoA thioester hydrolase
MNEKLESGVEPYEYRSRVSFHETDSMGVVHHANYLRYFEDARVGWMRYRKLIDFHIPRGSMVWAVLESNVQHKLSLYFDDIFTVRMRIRMNGIRTLIDYFLYSERYGERLVCQGATVLVPLGNNSKPCRPPTEFIKAIERELWIEI